jgi:hypothetical protein
MTQDSGLKSQPSRNAGKGSRPRPVRGSTYRERYAAIRWSPVGRGGSTAPSGSKSKSTSKETENRELRTENRL